MQLEEPVVFLRKLLADWGPTNSTGAVTQSGDLTDFRKYSRKNGVVTADHGKSGGIRIL